MNDILRLKKTVFSFKDLCMLWGGIEVKTAKSRVSYYVQQGELYRIRRGLYAKDKNYDRYELATKIFTPSYVSFETVLRSAGMIFQYYETIFVATYQSREIICDKEKYAFKKIKDSILTNNAGVVDRENYSIASPERAFLDTIYLHPNYYFDNLRSLNWEKVYEILSIYANKRMEENVKRYYKNYGTQSD